MAKTNPEESPMGKWVSYRPEIKILDCTVRDGGLMNDHLFNDDIVKAIYSACVDGGIDYMEIGYINSRRIFAPSKHGAWKFCLEDDIRRIVGENDTPLKLAAMADAAGDDVVAFFLQVGLRLGWGFLLVCHPGVKVGL